MDKIELSVLIPGKNEEFMQQTIDDVLRNSGEQTEVIAILDGYIPNPEIKSTDPRVTIIYNPESVGQRAAANQAAKIARGKYVMKIDAHCAFDKGFDVKMLQAFKEVGDDVTMAPTMRNLHAFDWVCENGHRRYQSPSGPCVECGKPTTKDVVWIAKTNPQSNAFRFDKTMHFQYYGELAKMQKGDITETMSLQGSCFMCTKEKYFELGLCGEEFNSWGQQGVEVACKTWLSGGRVLCNRRTWYAHMFRTQGGDFGFPYENPFGKVNENRELSRQLFQHDGWPKAIRKFQWILDHFNPPDWGITKGIIFYTDSELDEKIAKPVREQLLKSKLPITSSSLKRLSFGVKNVYFPSLKRSRLTMFKEILGALENCPHDIIFFAEHDVLYHPSHFDFVPQEKDVFYFNNNVWKVDLETGKAVKVDKCEQLSGMCVYKDTALEWVKEKIKQIEEGGFDGHYEPQGKRGGWLSVEPNIDIRHDGTQTPARWSKEQFRNQDNTKGWQEGTIDQLWAKDLLQG
jgi:glycosyltransferase involved in cell wall biosynthesis